MRDCLNAEMRDALPELLHGTLSTQRLVEVRAHVDACDVCRAELDLLERVRSSVRAPAVGVDRIVAGLPPYRPQPSWRRLVSAPALRVAAVIVILAGGAALYFRSNPTPARITAVDSSGQEAPAPLELAVGETFADVSDSALLSLVEAMEDLDAVLSEEPENFTVPLLPAEGL